MEWFGDLWAKLNERLRIRQILPLNWQLNVALNMQLARAVEHICKAMPQDVFAVPANKKAGLVHPASFPHAGKVTGPLTSFH